MSGQHALRWIWFGSKNSIDDDLIVWYPEILPSHEMLSICKLYENELRNQFSNANVCLGNWTQDKLLWCQKGTELAETNNSVIETWKGGESVSWEKLPRDPVKKIMGSLRAIIGRTSRSGLSDSDLYALLKPLVKEYSHELLKRIFDGNCGSKPLNIRRNKLLKQPETHLEELINMVPGNMFRNASISAMRMRTLGFRLLFLEQVPFDKLDWSNGRKTKLDRLKTVAFQMGQTLALLENVEIYDKDVLAERYPSLAGYLRRSNVGLEELHAFKKKFTDAIRAFKPNLALTEF